MEKLRTIVTRFTPMGSPHSGFWDGVVRATSGLRPRPRVSSESKPRLIGGDRSCPIRSTSDPPLNSVPYRVPVGDGAGGYRRAPDQFPAHPTLLYNNTSFFRASWIETLGVVGGDAARRPRRSHAGVWQRADLPIASQTQ